MSTALIHFVDNEWWLDGNIRPVAFYGYESHVTGAIFESGFHSGDSIDRIRTTLVKVFNEYKVKASVDNKVVFVVEYNGNLWTIGFYDLHFTVGLSFRKTF